MTIYLPIPGVLFCLVMEHTKLGEVLADRPAARLTILVAEMALWIFGGFLLAGWLS